MSMRAGAVQSLMGMSFLDSEKHPMIIIKNNMCFFKKALRGLRRQL